MMAQPSEVPLFHPFSVVGPQFIVPKPLEIIVDKYPCRNLVVTDINHSIILKVKPYDTRFHRQRVLLDANDKPIVMLRQKHLTMHGRWNAFRGDSKANSDIIFSAKTEHVIQFKTNVSVTLTNKMGGNDNCDLRIKGSWSKGNCTIFMGDSSIAIAQMHKPETSKYAKSKFTVTIQANIDYACVVALLAILDAMENPDAKHGSGADAVVGGVVDVIGAVLTN
ncbi:protein LURP-one-related 10-like [Bidens hawaiensis]|uniref:protein LURP-one-related 10-like n=1 Tax=Bidens hawaiensis TaxID=980011 RepID=UPI0040495C9A